jgi:transposase
MNITLTESEKEDLEYRHRKERDRRVADRFKAILLSAEGWTQKQIAQALRIRYETVQNHLNDYRNHKKLKPENGGSESRLSVDQAEKLTKHLEGKTYLKVKLICEYVQKTFGITFSSSGMTKWLTRNGFSYKKPKGTPAKANPEQQQAFIAYYQQLLNSIDEDEPVEFGDAVHPTMATKISYGWIRTGQDKLIATTASRTRMNILGSINLETMGITITDHETINSQSMKNLFIELKLKYPDKHKIHLILDRGAYNTSKETRASAKEYGVILHHLPPYSPNLNPIERLWKVMNEHARNNKVFKTAKEFRNSILEFFTDTWPKIATSMTDTINDNFQNIGKLPSN